MGLDVQTFIDKQDIYEVLARYCRGVDRCDVELVRSVYHADSYDDHGYWKGAGQDFADFVVPRLWNANSATMHSLSNVMIDVNEEGIAFSEAHVTVTLVRRGTDPVVADVMGARYVDRLSKRDGAWRIDERTVVLDWTKVETWPPANADIPLDNFSWGKRENRTDPIFKMLAEGSLRSETSQQTMVNS